MLTPAVCFLKCQDDRTCCVFVLLWSPLLFLPWWIKILNMRQPNLCWLQLRLRCAYTAMRKVTSTAPSPHTDWQRIPEINALRAGVPLPRNFGSLPRNFKLKATYCGRLWSVRETQTSSLQQVTPGTPASLVSGINPLDSKRVLGPLELEEKQLDDTQHGYGKPNFPARAVATLNHWTSSSAPLLMFLKEFIFSAMPFTININ